MKSADHVVPHGMALLAIAVLVIGCTRVPQAAPTASSVFGDPYALNHRLGRGVNLGNALEAPTEGEWGVRLSEQHAETHDRPIFLGEFGAYSKGDMASRARWTAFIAREAEARGISRAYWEFCAGFGVYDPGLKRWNEPLLQALMPPVEGA
jgi:hypothetical protein